MLLLPVYVELLMSKFSPYARQLHFSGKCTEYCYCSKTLIDFALSFSDSPYTQLQCCDDLTVPVVFIASQSLCANITFLRISKLGRGSGEGHEKEVAIASSS